jgi:hypothetical protein
MTHHSRQHRARRLDVEWRGRMLAVALAFLVGACGNSPGDISGQPPPSANDIAAAKTEAGLKRPGPIEAPPLSVDPERPLSGQDVTVRAAVADASSVTLALTGSGCGTLLGASGTSPLVVAGKAAAEGYCDITASMQLSGGATRSLMARFEVQAAAPNLPPITPTGGVHLLRAFPAASSSPDAPGIGKVDGPKSFVNGGSGAYQLTVTGGASVRAVLVKLPEYAGFFRVPATAAAGKVALELRVAPDYFQRIATARAARVQALTAAGPSAAASAGTVQEILLALEDVTGAVGPSVSQPLDGKEVKGGDVKVSISWDTPTDVDLHVTEPDREEVYFANPISATGGELDLDSNAGCTIDGVNNENISWPRGKSPNGDYTVSVQMYRSPCEGGPANASGVLTVAFCGKDSPQQIPFTLSGTGDRFPFTFTSSCGARVQGTVRYEDFPVTAAGLGGSQMVPVRQGRVQVVRAKDDAILAEGDTDDAGKYDVAFTNDGDHGVYVRVVARQDSATLHQTVADLTGKIYAYRKPASSEPPIDETKPPSDVAVFTVDLNVKKADGAGALNIFDVGLASSRYARAYTGETPPMLTFRWTDGQNSAASSTVSFYSADTSTIWVLGGASDSDEYDDVVLAHEYGHFMMSKYSSSDSPGGDHDPWHRAVPSLAWSEGWATFFGCASQGLSTYVDTQAGGVVGVSFNIETLGSSIPLGNAGDKLEGDLSEAVVSAVLYDIHDTTNETNDTISDRSADIWSVLRTYLKSGYGKYADRGAAGRDLVDFLDGWLCLGKGDLGSDDHHGLRGIVGTLSKLSYDYAGGSGCN